MASRIQEQAPKGGIYVSETVYNNIRNKAGIDCEFVSEQDLKNIDRPIKVYSVKIEPISVSEQTESFENLHQTNKKSIIVLPFADMSPIGIRNTLVTV